MLFRVKLATTHFCLSFILLLALFSTMYFCVYSWPLWHLQGAGTLLYTICIVDLCLGPLVTLIVSSPLKSSRELTRDLLIIAAIQLAAFVYGGYALWEARPVVLVLAVDRVEVVTANMLGSERLVAARARCDAKPKLYFPRWDTCWAIAKGPSDKKERERMLFSSLSGGADLSALPEYYVSLAEGQSLINAALTSIPDAYREFPSMATSLRAKIVEAKASEIELGVLWVAGRSKSAMLIVRKTTGALLDAVIE